MEIFLRDLKYAIRQLLNSRGFTIAALGTLALGIGANTAIFSVVYAVLLESLPFADASRIVAIAETHPRAHGALPVTYPDYLDWQNQQKSFEQIAAFADANPNTESLYRAGHSEQVRRVLASGNFFSLLGVTPLAGRTLTPHDDSPGSDHVAVLSEDAWRLYFGRDPSVVGSSIKLNGAQYTVVGVIPTESSFPADGDVWLPLSLLDQPTQASRVWHSVEVLGRLRTGITLAQATSDLRTIAGRLSSSYPATNRDMGVEVVPLRDRLVGSFRTAMLCVMGAVAVVLLIACVNVANLLLVRASANQRQIAIRRSLGGTRGRLISQQLALSLCICLLGGAIGTGLGWALLPMLRFFLSHLPGIDAALVHSVRLSFPVLALTVGVCLLTAGVFGILPALETTPNFSQTLRTAGRTVTRHSGRGRNLLLSAEIAIAVVVLFLGMLFARSFGKLLSVAPGYQTERLLSFEITLPGPKFQLGAPATDQFYEQLIDRISRAPGVVSVAASNEIPLNPSRSMTRFLIQGAPPVAAGAFPVAQIRVVNPGFFTTMGLRLEQGRIFTQTELSDRSNVFVVNRSFAEQFLRGRDPVGAQIVIGVLSPHPAAVPIIGIVSSAHDIGIESDPPPEIFTAGYGLHEVLLVRVNDDPQSIVPVVQNAVHSIDPEQPVYHLQTVDQVLSNSIARQRMTAILLNIFAFAALALTGIGVSGVVSYAVAQRTQEIGIRLAVGAQRSDILKLVVKQAARFGISGLTVGIVLGALCTRTVRGLMFHMSAIDPASSFGAVIIVIAMIAMGVAVPLLRAAQINPIEALRAE
jgi:predicted permease